MLNLYVTVNVMHGGWLLYQVSIFIWSLGNGTAFSHFRLFYQPSLSCFNFFLSDYKFFGIAVLLMEILYISKGLKQVGTVYGKYSRNHPLFIISVSSKCHTIFDRATSNLTSKIMSAVTVESTVTVIWLLPVRNRCW